MNVLPSDTERNPIRFRTQPNHTPNATRLDSERNPIRFRTQPDQIPNANDAYSIAIHSLKSFFWLSFLNLILTKHQLAIDNCIDRKHYANAYKETNKRNEY